MATIQTEIQSLDTTAMISLFSLDTRDYGGSVLLFTQGYETTSPVSFGGLIYTPVDIKFDGLETSGVGALPTPTLTLANTDGMVQAIVNAYGDLNGAQVTRTRTFARFLDGQPGADSNASIGPDVYRVERKVSDTPTEIQWELSAAPDQAGQVIPGRPAIRGTCLWRYRYWNGSSFNYSNAMCPYTGTKYYDAENNPVTSAANDKPSRTVDCCKTRFGKNKVLPFGGFPGMGRGI
jgi:lambda family phage minor tail protein L